MPGWPGIVSGILCAAVVHLGSPPAGHTAELTEAEFRRLHKRLQPPPDAPWRSIPWKIDLLDAQKTAAAQQKPLFIWAMDGHPLGCT